MYRAVKADLEHEEGFEPVRVVHEVKGEAVEAGGFHLGQMSVLLRHADDEAHRPRPP